jgi:hypothetical protein
LLPVFIIEWKPKYQLEVSKNRSCNLLPMQIHEQPEIYPLNPQFKNGYLKRASSNNTKRYRILQDKEGYNMQYSFDTTIKIDKLLT